MILLLHLLHFFTSQSLASDSASVSASTLSFTNVKQGLEQCKIWMKFFRSRHQKYSVRKGVLRNLLNPQENTCARLSFLRYYATFKVRKFESLLYKINTCLQKTTTCIGLRAQEIFSVNIWYTYFSILGVAFVVLFLCYFQKL